MTSRTKQALVATGSVVVVTASLLSMFWPGSTPDAGLAFHKQVGRVLAEQTAGLLGKQGQVVIITLDPARFPIFRAQLDGFRQTLRQRGRIQIARRIVLRPEGESAYGLGSGLSAAEFLRIRNESRQVDAIVSLLGVPSLRSAQIRKLGVTKPMFVAEAKFGGRLQKLLDNQVVQVALVPRFMPATAQTKHHGNVAVDRFDLYFQVLKAPPQAVVSEKTRSN